ncbi:MAG TPA: SIS domain-containing protein [Vicinamibacteria bacterium]|nr:SIS domain-containing protein [Vicinamibacteria bacterium]
MSDRDHRVTPAWPDGAASALPAEGLDAWFSTVAGTEPWRSLLDPPPPERESRGYGHTLREILQQPLTWEDTAQDVAAARGTLERVLRDSGVSGGQASVLLTGSGSSLFAGECVALVLQAALGVPVQAVPAGLLLTHAESCVPRDRPCLVVSLARSGNSPESCGAVDLLLARHDACRHLVITCNGAGRLATRYRGEPRVARIVLRESTNDRSLVMTSSLTNMVLALGALGFVGELPAYADRVRGLAVIGRSLLLDHGERLAALARRPFRSVLFLGTGCRFGSAREGSLKMLEMSEGRVSTSCESFLGLRHGPMSGIRADTLVVCFLSSDTVARAYEIDLLRELNRKQLGLAKAIVGESIPEEVLLPGDLTLECPGLASQGDDRVPVIDVLVAQVLAFFRSLFLGLHPDAPSPNGVISRVVETFEIHGSR